MEGEKINNIILKIKYEGKEEDIFCNEYDLLSESLKKFTSSKNKSLEDFVFYFEDSEIKIDNFTIVHGADFGNKESKIVKISAVLKEEKKNNPENNVEEEKKEDKPEKNEIKININQDEEENKKKIEKNKIMKISNFMKI